MHVVVNQWAPLAAKTGIGHYTDQLMLRLQFQAGHDQVSSFPANWVRRGRDLGGRIRSALLTATTTRDGDDRNGDSQLFRGKIEECPHFWHGLSQMKNSALGQLRAASWFVLGRHFRAVSKKRAYDLYHEPNFIPLPADCPTLATIHDLSVLLHPEWHPADRVAWFERRFPEALRQCMHFLTISEFGRQEVVQRLNVPPERVTRTYMGIRSGLTPLPAGRVAGTLARLGLPPRYLLYVGTIEPRKNVRILMQAYCALPPAVRSRWPLVMVGAWGWNMAREMDYFHGEARHRGVVHLGYLPDEHLAAVYNGARALVYPSWYEGFGLPPLEMMACGGAVLSSTAGALVETSGKRAHLIDPADLAGWRDAMKRVVEDDEWWSFLRRDVVEIASPYTWERCAAETLAVYRRLCGVSTCQAATSGCAA